jgi:hypothetical protein
MASPVNERRLADSLLSVNVALPNAANTVNTSGIDLAATTPFPVTTNVWVNLSVAVATGANNKNVNVVLQDSADNSTFANISTLGAPVLVASGNTANVIATQTNIALPPGTRRYLRASATGEANGGNSADGTLTVKLVF